MGLDLQTVLRCHLAAFAALGGVPRQILYDRMKTAVLGEDAEGHIVYNRALVDFARHHGFHPRACRPYRAKTTDEVEQPLSALCMLSTIAHRRPRGEEPGVR